MERIECYEEQYGYNRKDHREHAVKTIEEHKYYGLHSMERVQETITIASLLHRDHQTRQCALIQFLSNTLISPSNYGHTLNIDATLWHTLFSIQCDIRCIKCILVSVHVM